MADETKPELVEVELQGGIKIPMPKDAAEKYAAARTKDKAERESLAKRMGEFEAKATAEAEAKTKAEQEASLAKLTSKEEFTKALELHKKQSADELARVANNLRDMSLKGLLQGNPKLAAIEDAEARSELASLLMLQLAPSCGYDLKTNTLNVLGDGGAVALDNEMKPVRADAWIGQKLDASPLLKTRASQGTGGTGSGKNNSGVTQKFTRTDLAEGRVPQELVNSGNYELI